MIHMTVSMCPVLQRASWSGGCTEPVGIACTTRPTDVPRRRDSLVLQGKKGGPARTEANGMQHVREQALFLEETS